VKKKKLKKLAIAEEANTETAINNELMDTALSEDTTLVKEYDSIELSVEGNVGKEMTDELIENIELNTNEDTVVQTLNFDEAVDNRTITGLENNDPKSAKKKKKRTRKSLMKVAESDTTSAEEDANSKIAECADQASSDEVPTIVEEATQKETLDLDSKSDAAAPQPEVTANVEGENELENDAPKSAKKKKKRTRKSMMKAAESDTTSVEEDANTKAVESTNQVASDEIKEATQNET